MPVVKNKRWPLLVVVAAAALLAVFFWRRGHEPAATTEAAPPPSSPAAARSAGVAAQAHASVAGRVTDTRGAAVAGASVRLVPGGRGGGAPAVARAGADGTFKLADLAPGRWSAGASAPGFLPVAVEELELVAGRETPLELRLSPGGRAIKGTVTDRTGGAIAGALVEATPLHGMLSARDRRVAAALTDENGKYQVHVSEGRHRVAASHPDYVREGRVVDVGAAGATVDLALTPGGVIEGVVREHGSGDVVPGAEVTYDREAVTGLPLGGNVTMGRGRGSVTADDAGRFRVTGVEPGTIRMTARASGRASREPLIVAMGVAGQVTGVEVYVGGAYAIRGRVTFEDGEAAAGADVNVFGDAGRASTVADARGHFVVDGLPPGSFFVMASTDASLPGRRPRNVELRDRDVDGLELSLRRGVYVTGRVEPAGIAEVAPRMDPEMPRRGRMMMLQGRTSTLTGPDGKFRLGPLEPGKMTLAARAADGRRGEVELDIPAEGVNGVTITLETGSGLAGRVVDESGAPVPGSVVHIRRGEGGDAPRMSVVVNGLDVGAERAPAGEDGRWSIQGLEAGSYELTAHGDDGEPLAFAREGKPPVVAVEAGERREGVELVVEARDGVLRGVVLSPEGRPLPDAWVTAMPQLEPGAGAPARRPGGGGGPMRQVMRSAAIAVTDDGVGVLGGGGGARALTDDSGRFEITGLRRGKYRVMGEGLAGAARGMLDGVETGSDVTLRLAALRKLEGKVTFNGKPVEELTVELQGPSSRRQTFRDAGGAFTIQRVDPGTYKVSVIAPEGGGQAEAVVPVESTAPPATVEVALQPNGKVSGKAVGADGSPLSGRPVLTAPNTGDGRLTIRLAGEPQVTGPDGSFSLEVAAGRHYLVVLGGEDGPPGPAVRHAFAIAAGQTLDLGTVKPGPPPPP